MTTWHAPQDALVRFARAPEALDPTTAASIEQHLVACSDCRALVAEAADPAPLAASWAAITDVLDQPRATLSERVLTRFGMPTGMARIVGATPGLRLAWLATVAFLAVAAVGLARRSGSESLFLAVAPLLPLGSVLLAFLPTEEPGGEAAAATPLYGAGVVLRRAVATLVPSFIVVGVASAALPDLADAARWLLPGLALSLGSLALSTYVRPLVASTGLTAAWVALLTGVQAYDGRTIPLSTTVLFATEGQVVAVLLAAAAAVVLNTRRDRFATMEVTW